MSTQDIVISTDQSRLDIDFMYRSLTQETYWGKDFQLDEFKNALKHSLVFGLYLKSGEQIGFCRVITDYMTLAYITDTFIKKEYRGGTIVYQLLKDVNSHESLKNVRRWLAVSKDIHPIARKYGFEIIENPDIYLEKSKLKV